MTNHQDSQPTTITPAGGPQLHYEIAGAGHPLVMLHDGLIDCRVWDDQFPAFAASYTVVRYDRRGYGRSERPWQDYSNVDDLHALLRALEVERAILMGASAGGLVAIDFALAHPGMADALVLIGPAVDRADFFGLQAQADQVGNQTGHPVGGIENVEAAALFK